MLSNFQVSLLLLAFVSVECQLQFNANQVGTELTVRCDCSPSALQAANVAHVISMGISKTVNGQDETLLSTLTVDGSTVTHNIEDGVVSSDVKFDASQCSVQIVWPFARNTMSGDYKCILSGLDANNLPVSLTENLQLSLKDAEPSLSATPHIIKSGLSRDLVLRCSVQDFSSINLQMVTSMELSYVHNNIEQLLASISVFDPAEAKPGSDIDSVSGYIGNSGTNYLSATWLYPDADNAGDYECQILGIDTNSMPVQFLRQMEITSSDPSKEELLDKIKELDLALSSPAGSNSGISQADYNNVTRLYNLYRDLYGNVSNDLAIVNGELSAANSTITQLQTQLSLLQQGTSTASSQSVFSCDFDNPGMCRMIQITTDDMDWTLKNWSTDSVETGPTYDHTLANLNGYYMYLEASSGNAGYIARLKTPSIPAHSQPNCLIFWYHMYGNEMGSLNVYLESGSTESIKWSASGQKGDQWLKAGVDLPAESSSTSIIFEAERGSNFKSDIAIDDVSITEGRCV